MKKTEKSDRKKTKQQERLDKKQRKIDKKQAAIDSERYKMGGPRSGSKRKSAKNEDGAESTAEDKEEDQPGKKEDPRLDRQ